MVYKSIRFLVSACIFSPKIFLNKQPNPRKKLLVPCALDPPNPNCYVCASKPEVTVRLNVHKVTVLTLQDKVSVQAGNLPQGSFSFPKKKENVGSLLRYSLT